jgi:multiple sugar transport system substrate-binding protein
MKKLYSDVTSLYRLDQLNNTSSEKADLGPLPKTAVILLTALGTVWVSLGIIAGYGWLSERRKKAS